MRQLAAHSDLSSHSSLYQRLCRNPCLSGYQLKDRDTDRFIPVSLSFYSNRTAGQASESGGDATKEVSSHLVAFSPLGPAA
jgi:hypothetical protein